jgi:hypothetical protein
MSVGVGVRVMVTVDVIGTTVVSGTAPLAKAVAGTDIVVVSVVAVDSVVATCVVGSAEK